MEATTYTLQDWQKRAIAAGEIEPHTYVRDGKVYLPRLPKPRQWWKTIHPCESCCAPRARGRVYCPIITKIINSQRCRRIGRKDGIAARAYFTEIDTDRRRARKQRRSAKEAQAKKRRMTAAGSVGRATSGPATDDGIGMAPTATSAIQAIGRPDTKPDSIIGSFSGRVQRPKTLV